MSTIGSGLDINGIVAGLIQIETRTRIAPIQVRQVGLNTQLSLYGQIKSSFSKFEDSAAALMKAFTKYEQAYNSTDKKTITNNGNGTVTIYTPGNGESEFINTKTTTNSNPAAISLRNEPTYGTYDISVQNLNRGQELRVATGSTNANAEFGGGLLTATFANGRQETFSFSQDPGNGSVQNATSQDIVDGINTANKGLSAVFDAATGEIVISSTGVGAGNAFALSTSGELDQRATGVFNPAFGPNDGNNNAGNNAGFSRLRQGVITQTARDTTVTIDNGTGPQTFSSFLGSFDELGLQFDVLDFGTSQVQTFDREDPNPDFVGPTTETRAVAPGDPADGETRVLTGPSTAELTSSIDAFIAEYNALVKKLKASQSKGTELDRDTTPFRLEARMREIFNQVVGGTETKLDLGFSISKEGVLSLDSDKLSSKLLNDPTAFKRIFADKIAKDFESFADLALKEGGAINAKEAQLNRRLADLRSKETREDFRIDRLEILYRKQFVALDKALTQLQASQGFLAQGLAQLQATFNQG